MYTFPNQKIVTVSKTPCQGTLFAQYNMEAFLDAAQALDAGAFKLWCYLAMNQDEYTFALSSKDARERFGLKKTQYDNAVEKLIKQGYLINRGTEEESNSWFFKDACEPPLEEEAPLFDNRTTACDETEQGLSGNKTSPHKEVEKEMRPCIETEQGLYGKESSGCIETSRSSVENQTRNNINKIDSINIEYGSEPDDEEAKTLYIDSRAKIPYSKEALASDKYIDGITSVPNNYCTIKAALENGDVPKDLEERYGKYLEDAFMGNMRGLFSIR